ncbi:MAG: hypothetical protein LBL69_05625 [Zoogloeaceae bacterium]|jgi:MinD-like ATPase involved in chromosome partitioning or flagellar assembly|nr:hypothetical protein [Zoogloeaceae bacterium]
MLDVSHDQALGLRRLFRPEGVAALALAAGAPGAGVSALAANLVAALRGFGRAVLLVRDTQLIAPPSDAPPDLLLLDGADLSVWAEVADEAALIVAPTRASVIGAARLLQNHPRRRFRLLFNRMPTPSAAALFESLQRLSPLPPTFLGNLPDDPAFSAAWEAGQCLVDTEPNADFSLRIKALAAEIARWPQAAQMSDNGDQKSPSPEPADE